MPENSKILTTGDVADYCGVSRMGVLRWIRDGKLQAYTTPGGHYRIRRPDFRRFLEQHRIPVDGPIFDERVGRVLVAASEAPMLGVIVKALSLMPEGYELDVALDAASLLDKIAGFKPSLIVLDALLPGIEAPAFSQWVNDNGKENRIPVLVLQSPAAQPARQADSALCLISQGQLTLDRSPLEPERLQALVRRLVDCE